MGALFFGVLRHEREYVIPAKFDPCALPISAPAEIPKNAQIPAGLDAYRPPAPRKTSRSQTDEARKPQNPRHTRRPPANAQHSQKKSAGAVLPLEDVSVSTEATYASARRRPVCSRYCGGPPKAARPRRSTATPAARTNPGGRPDKRVQTKRVQTSEPQNASIRKAS